MPCVSTRPEIVASAPSTASRESFVVTGLYRDQGVVLRTYRLGESDRIVVVHDPGSGQDAGRRQGCAQDQEPFGSRLEPL